MMNASDIASRMQCSIPTDRPLYQTLHQKNMDAVRKFAESQHDDKMIWSANMMSVMSQAELTELLHTPAKERLEFMNKVFMKCKGE